MPIIVLNIAVSSNKRPNKCGRIAKWQESIDTCTGTPGNCNIYGMFHIDIHLAKKITRKYSDGGLQLNDWHT